MTERGDKRARRGRGEGGGLYVPSLVVGLQPAGCGIGPILLALSQTPRDGLGQMLPISSTLVPTQEGFSREVPYTVWRIGAPALSGTGASAYPSLVAA